MNAKRIIFWLIGTVAFAAGLSLVVTLLFASL